MVYSQSFSKDLEISHRTRTVEPQIDFRAEVRRDVFMSDIFLGLSAGFTLYGAVHIEVNDRPVFTGDIQGQFRNYQNYPIGTNNKVLRNGERVKIWAWSLNGSTINLTVSFSVGVEKFEAGKNPESINALTVSRLLSENPEVSTDTTAITEGLDSVRESLGELIDPPDDNLTLTSTKDMITNAMNTATGPYMDALTTIINALNAAEDDFNQNTLETLIAAIADNLLFIESQDLEIHSKLEAALNNLRQIHETAPILRSSEETALFPHELLTDEEHTALLNLFGAKNMILVINAAPQNPFTFLLNSAIQDYPNTEIPMNSNANLPEMIIQRKVYDLQDQVEKDLLIRIDDTQETDLLIRRFFNHYDRFSLVFGTGNFYRCYNNLILHDLTLRVRYRIRFGNLRNNPDQGFPVGISDPQSETLLTENTVIERTTSRRYLQIDKLLTVQVEREYRPGTHLPNHQCPIAPVSADQSQADLNRVFWQAIPVPEITTAGFEAEFSDRNRTGGSIELSGEIRDHVGEWHEYITSQEMGGVGPDDSPILLTSPGSRTIQFGELTTGRLMPSSASLFRLRLKVNGAAEVSVDIIRIV